MPVCRRLIAAIAACSLGWAVLLPGATSAPAQAAGREPVPAVPSAAPHDPATYYAGTEGLSGATLAAALHTIVKGHTTLSYAQLWTALPRTDPAPGNPNALTDFYSGTSILVSAQCGSGSCAGKWNREHTWPQSHGGFGTTAGIGTDLHHMRPSFADTNSSRGNLDFDNTAPGTPVPSCGDCRRDNDSFEPRAAVKGDVARGLFYMAVRYEADDSVNLKMNDLTCNGSGAPNMGKLSTLVSWSLADPPDASERARNDLVDGDYQGNRNPFIDHPEWVTSIFGSGVGQGPACGGTSGSDYVPGGTTPANTPPTATPTSASTAEDTAAAVSLVGSDADGDPLTWTVLEGPAHGTASTDGATLNYVPARDFHGTDQVGVSVSDGRGGTASTTVTITVTPVNDAPVAVAVATGTPAAVSLQVPLVGSDVDDAVNTLTYAAAQPAHGAVTVDGATATYTPAAGFSGPDSFTYVVRDPAGATSSAEVVTIAVSAPQQPVASSTSVSTAEDAATTFPLTGSGSGGAPLEYALSSTPAHGAVTLTGNQATFTPDADFNGVDAFTFTVSDGSSTSTSATASITVTPVNDAPTVTGLQTSTPVGAPVTVSLADLQAVDVDGDTVAISGVSDALLGSVQVTGSAVTYTAPRKGNESLLVTVTDGRGEAAQAEVDIVVTPLVALVGLASPGATRGTRVTTTVTVTGPSSTPTGTVTLASGGTTLGTGRLRADGTAVVAWTPGRAGTTTLVASYGGDLSHDRAQTAPATLSVARSAARVSVTAGTLRRGRAGVVRVAVARVGVAATGRVTVSIGGSRLTASLVGGVATLRVARLPKVARVGVTARYSGDTQYAPGSASRTFRLRR